MSWLVIIIWYIILNQFLSFQNYHFNNIILNNSVLLLFCELIYNIHTHTHIMFYTSLIIKTKKKFRKRYIYHLAQPAVCLHQKWKWRICLPHPAPTHHPLHHLASTFAARTAFLAHLVHQFRVTRPVRPCYAISLLPSV